MSRSILMAVHPVFENAIYCGSKLFEFRRVRAKVHPGDHVFVYESYPKSCLSGEFEAGQVITGSATDLALMETDPHIRMLVKRYFSSARIAAAIEILRPKLWDKCIDLVDLFPGYRPPQSYTFIRS